MSTAHGILTQSDKFLIKLGLERVEKVLKFLGNPQESLNVVHVAGTNGKGSICSILAGIFRANSVKTGLFLSPHLFSYCERIKINGEDIEENELDELVAFVCETSKKCDVKLTEFEILTVAAFYYFAQKKVDVVVLETGLGGRLDATNVAKKPVACVISSISHDHTQRLGETIEEIAFEKAGIIKTAVPVVVAKKNAGYKVIETRAKEIGANVLNPSNCEIKDGHAHYKGKKYEFGLLGAHQAENLSLALRVAEILNIPENAIVAGLKNVRHRFRIEYIKEKKLIIDACHNPDGARVLRNFLDDNFKDARIKFVFGCLNNKDCLKMLTSLVGEEDELCFYEFNYPNALKFEELPMEFRLRARQTQNPLQETGGEKLTVVCGSIYMLGEIFKPL